MATELIVHGTLSAKTQCVSPDGGQAFTFTQMTPSSTLLGDWLNPQNEASSALTVQFFGGTYADGSVSGFTAAPRLSVGDEVILLLQYDSNGIPNMIPTGDPDRGVFRVVDLGSSNGTHGTTAIVNGDGRAYLMSSRGPYAGPRVAYGRSQMPFDDNFSETGAATSLLEVADDVTLPGTALPYEGAWQARAVLSITNPSTGDAGSCSSLLVGEAGPNGDLTLSGSCNMPHVGKTAIVAEAVYDGADWETTITATPVDDRIPSRAMDVVTTWSANDSFTATGTTEETQASTLYRGDAYISAAFGGLQPLATRTEVLDWLADLVETSEAPGGTGWSVRPESQSCNVPAIPVAVQ